MVNLLKQVKHPNYIVSYTCQKLNLFIFLILRKHENFSYMTVNKKSSVEKKNQVCCKMK